MLTARLPAAGLAAAAALLILALVPACAGRPGAQPGSGEGAAGGKESSAVESTEPCDGAFRTAELSEPGQVRIDCANGQSFVVRRGPEGRWAEEAKSRGGTRPTWASAEEAARALCGCG